MKLILVLLIFAVALALFATISGAVIYVGWNWGVLDAFPAANLGVLTFWQAVALGLVVAVIGTAFNRARSNSK
jgi:hypothetical protein